MLLPAQETKIALVRLYSRLEFELEPGQVPLQVRERRLWGLSQRNDASKSLTLALCRRYRWRTASRRIPRTECGCGLE